VQPEPPSSGSYPQIPRSKNAFAAAAGAVVSTVAAVPGSTETVAAQCTALMTALFGAQV
jgi:hypothetical protein